jgi:hypothetical protein
MRPLNIYIETSVFNFYFSEQDEEKRQHTLKLFEEIKDGKYKPHASASVLEELTKAPEPKKSNMIALISEYEMEMLLFDENAEHLADVYVNERVIPEKYRMDGVHIALTAVNGWTSSSVTTSAI